MGKIFVSYAHEDLETAKRLYFDLKKLRADPWLNKEDLLPGQDWESTIGRVIKGCSHVLAIVSRHSVNKRGFIQKELRQALDVLQEFPPVQIFIIPCRLDDTRPSHDRLAKLHWVDLFPSYEDGLARIAKSLGLEPPETEEKGDVSDRRRQRPIGPTEMPDEVRDLIRKKAEEDFPDDFSTRLYQSETEVNAWEKLQQLMAPGIPQEDLRTIVEKAEVDFPDDFSTRLYQINTEIAAWRDLYDERDHGPS